MSWVYPSCGVAVLLEIERSGQGVCGVHVGMSRIGSVNVLVNVSVKLMIVRVHMLVVVVHVVVVDEVVVDVVDEVKI